MKTLRIFTASPSDVTAERDKVETIVAALELLADHIGVALEVIDWRKAVPDMGRPQKVIFDQLKPTTWDVFIGILWHRFGTPPGGVDPQTQKEYLSGTEEEFRVAYRLWQKYKKPRIMMYRCTRSIPPEALDPDQFKRVKEFFAEFEALKGEHPGLYQQFDSSEPFEKLLLDNLLHLLISYSEEEKQQPLHPQTIQALAPPRMPDTLPRRAAFFGRQNEMDRVMRALSPEERGWGAVIDGIGGIGKTALAVEAAYRAKEQEMFAAYIFVSAKQSLLTPGGIRDQSPAAVTVDGFLGETARALGQPGIAQLTGDPLTGAGGKRRALLDVLRARRALLIYDNLETLAKEEQEALADWLRFLPQGCKALLTSRRRGGEGALWLRLEKLEWEAACRIIAEEAKKDARLEKKLQDAGERRWRDLYDETRGSPLALVHVLGLMRARATLTFDGALDLLRGSRDADLQRFVFQEARKELGDSEIAALRALAFFAPSASFEALTEVADLSRNALEMALDRLDALSLLEKPEGAERYALHPLTRAYARDDLLAEAQTAHAIGTRFARCWLDYANRYGGLSQNYATFNRLEAEWPNLEAAANWLWETAAVQDDAVGDKDAARMLNDLASALSNFLWFGGRWDERVTLNERAYHAARALQDWSQAGWRSHSVALIHYNRARTDETAEWVERCAEAWARGGGKLEQTTATRLRGLVARQREDYAAAERLLQEALAVRRDLGLDKDVAIGLTSLGGLEQERKEYDAAERYYREALEIDEKLNDKEGKATACGNLGELALDRRQWAQARGWYEQALPLAQEVGQLALIAQAKYGLARLEEHAGRLAQALPLAQEALAIEERLQDKDLAQVRELVERLEADVKRKSG